MHHVWVYIEAWYLSGEGIGEVHAPGLNLSGEGMCVAHAPGTNLRAIQHVSS